MDTRISRRWNLDPVDQINISNYAVNGLNPIVNIDPLGDDWYKNKSGDAVHNKALSKSSNMKKLGLKGKYLGSTFSGHTSKGLGISGDKDGVISYNYGSIPEVTISDYGSSRFGRKSTPEEYHKPLENAGRMMNLKLLDLNFDIYIGHQAKGTGIRNGLSVTIPTGAQIGYNTQDGAYGDAITPDNSYINLKRLSGVLDLRVYPTNGIMRGDWNPGARALITVRSWKVMKIQLDAGMNKSTLTLGARGAFETPKEIAGIAIPVSYEINGGFKVKMTANDYSNFKWSD